MNLVQRIASVLGMSAALSSPLFAQQPCEIVPTKEYERCTLFLEEFGKNEPITVLGKIIPGRPCSWDDCVALLRDDRRFYCVLVGQFSDKDVASISEIYQCVQTQTPGIVEQLEPVIVKVGSFSDKKILGLSGSNYSSDLVRKIITSVRAQKNQVDCDNLNEDARKIFAYQQFVNFYSSPQQDGFYRTSWENDDSAIDVSYVTSFTLANRPAMVHELIGHPTEGDFPVVSLFQSITKLSEAYLDNSHFFFSEYAQQTALFFFRMKQEMLCHILRRSVPYIDQEDKPQTLPIPDTARAMIILNQMFLTRIISEDYCDALPYVCNSDEDAIPQPTDQTARISLEAMKALIGSYLRVESKLWSQEQK